jgi:hypothetical protein
MISYEVFMKHAEKVTKNAPEVRNILSGVKHLENGNAIVTDSHRLYVAKGIHNRTDGAVISPKGKKVDGNYPDVSRIIPDESYAKQTMQIEVSELLRAADMIAAVGTAEVKTPALEFKDKVIRYQGIEVHISYSFAPLVFEAHICANAIYLLEAMKLFKAVGCQTVTVHFHGPMRPFTLSNEDESLLALILPIRKY